MQIMHMQITKICVKLNACMKRSTSIYRLRPQGKTVGLNNYERKAPGKRPEALLDDEEDLLAGPGCGAVNQRLMLSREEWMQ